MNLELLRKKRIERGYRQKDIAEALGKTKALYSLLENGRVKMTIEYANTIKRELNLTEQESKEIFGI